VIGTDCTGSCKSNKKKRENKLKKNIQTTCANRITKMYSKIKSHWGKRRKLHKTCTKGNNILSYISPSMVHLAHYFLINSTFFSFINVIES
jgi:hypothetical protein